MEVVNTVGMEEPYFYRNKVQTPVQKKGKNILAGFYKEDSHEIIPYDRCFVQDDLSNKIIKAVVAAMKENRVLVLPEGASASWLTKAASDAQVENILKRIHDSIYRIAACPDFSSESFVGGVSSGVAIRYRLTGMETRAAKICAEMKKALQRRIEIITGIASLKLGEEVFRDIKIDFKRNIPEDATATIAMINSLKGTVSDATLLSQLDFIPDVNAELEAVQAQKQANIEAFGLGLTNAAYEEENAVEEE